MGILVLIIPGTYLLLHGIWLLRGGSKGWFFSRNIYAGGVCYTQIPGGIAFFCFVVAAIPDVSLIFVNMGIGFLVIAFIFNFLQPSFLKPAWLKWLEHEHKDVMDFLVADAHKIGLDVWEKRVSTQEGLEEWVTEVRRKHEQNH